ncbi:MAG: S8/S53 family peptidase [Bdellovibrionota bacterium]
MQKALLLICSVFLTVSCSQKKEESYSDSDKDKIESAIVRMQKGELIRQIEQAANDNVDNDSDIELPDVPGLDPPSLPPSLDIPGDAPSYPPDAVPEPADVSTENPCDAPRPSDKERSKEDVIKKLGACMRDQLERPLMLEDAFKYFQTFKLEKNSEPLSSLSDEDLDKFLKANKFNSVDTLLGGLKADKLRNSFSDDELKELVALASKRKQALSTTANNIFALVEANIEIFNELAKTINRYQLLLALNELSKALDSSAPTNKIMEKILKICVAARISVPTTMEIKELPVGFLIPYAIEVVVPDEGYELKPLHWLENPFEVAKRGFANLGDHPDVVKKTLITYSMLRESERVVKLPEHPEPSPDAAHVAIIDSGVDFLTFPDLGLFLGREGKKGELASFDYADDDANPWLSAISDNFSHGSSTSATLLTVAAHYAPEVLRERKLDLAVWKMYSIRDMLAGTFQDITNWRGRFFPILDSVIASARSGKDSLKPKVVSVSMSFNTKEFLSIAKQEDLIKNTPWLWVMSAGNEGVDVNQVVVPSCFNDLAADKRSDARILCVGALVRGIVNDKITSYSNFGKRVEVYAYESYTNLCPNGTSCSTPAVASTAAILAAKFPKITPEQIKEVILESAEERELETDGDNFLGPYGTLKKPVLRTIKVFDPTTMLQVAIENAKKKLGL